MFEAEANKWLQENATLYRGDNASDCMVSAFIAGVREAMKSLEIPEEKSCECGKEIKTLYRAVYCDDCRQFVLKSMIESGMVIVEEES